MPMFTNGQKIHLCRGILFTVCGVKNVKHSELAKTYTVCMTWIKIQGN